MEVFFYFRGNFLPDFWSSKLSQRGSSIIIVYPWPMKINYNVGYKSGVVTMNLRG